MKQDKTINDICFSLSTPFHVSRIPNKYAAI